jgi:Fe2+ transport system protein FeoA
MLSKQVEGYLKTIYDIAGKNNVIQTTAVAKCINLSPPSVTGAMQKMAEKGLVAYEPYKGDNLTKNMNIVPITDLAPCEKGFIAFLRGDKKVVQRLSDLGLTLNTEIELLRKAPMKGPIEVCIRRTNLAIAREIADNIFVNSEG